MSVLHLATYLFLSLSVRLWGLYLFLHINGEPHVHPTLELPASRVQLGLETSHALLERRIHLDSCLSCPLRAPRIVTDWDATLRFCAGLSFFERKIDGEVQMQTKKFEVVRLVYIMYSHGNQELYCRYSTKVVIVESSRLRDNGFNFLQKK